MCQKILLFYVVVIILLNHNLHSIKHKCLQQSNQCLLSVLHQKPPQEQHNHQIISFVHQIISFVYIKGSDSVSVVTRSAY